MKSLISLRKYLSVITFALGYIAGYSHVLSETDHLHMLFLAIAITPIIIAIRMNKDD